MHKLIAFFTVISLLIVFGCGNDSTGPSENSDYLPLAVGNQWNYSLSGHSITTDADTTIFSGSCISKVLETVTHQQGFQLYTIQDSITTIITTPDTSFTITETDTSYAYNTGTEWRLYEDTISTEFDLVLKLPVTLGNSWIPYITEPTITRTVLSLSESVTVPAGSYSSCANLRDTDSEEPDFYFDLFLSRGTGAVKYIRSNTDPDGTVYMVYSLTSSIIN